MGREMNVDNIIKEWLLKNKYNGLYWENECGCDLDDFAPCGNVNPDCTAGCSVFIPGGERRTVNRDDLEGILKDKRCSKVETLDELEAQP